jgi:hypothetical protein
MAMKKTNHGAHDNAHTSSFRESARAPNASVDLDERCEPPQRLNNPPQERAGDRNDDWKHVA